MLFKTFGRAVIAFLLTGCAELDGLASAGAIEGKALLNRLNTAVNSPPESEANAVVATEPDDASAGGPSTRSKEPQASASPVARREALPGMARERFLAAYALLGCSQSATSDPVERERRRAELFRILNYTNSDWLGDLRIYGTGEAEALKALCRP